MEKVYSTIRGLGLKRGPQRWLGGVCGGIAAKLNVDVAFVRIAFLLFALLPGPAFVLYLAAWLILPDQQNAIALESFLAKRQNPPKLPSQREWPDEVPRGRSARTKVPLPPGRGTLPLSSFVSCHTCAIRL